MLDKLQVERTFARIGGGPAWSDLGDSFGLVEAGIAAVARLLTGDG